MVILESIKKDFQSSKQATASNLVDTDQIVVSEKFKYNDGSSKYFIGYLDDYNIIRTLCIILPQMSGYIKYFDDGGKNTSFKIEDESVYLEYNEIWNKIKRALNKRFHSQPIYDDKYIKTKVKTFNGVIHSCQTIKFRKKGIIAFLLQEYILILS